MALPENLQICRTCVLKASSLANIFGEKGALGFSISDLINELLDLNVHPGDGLPDKICCSCLNELARFKRFKNICHEAKVTLEYILKRDKAEVLPQAIKSETSEDQTVAIPKDVEIVDLDDSSDDEDSGAETVSAPSPPPISISTDDDSSVCSSKNVMEDNDEIEIICEPSTSAAAVSKIYTVEDEPMENVSKEIASDIDKRSRNVTTIEPAGGDPVNDNSCEGRHILPECSTSQSESKNHAKKDDFFICPFCAICITSASAYREHMVKCNKDKVSFICQVCNKPFIDAISLQSHEVIHSNDKPKDDGKPKKSTEAAKGKKMYKLYKCGVCYKAYKKISSLRKHMQRHEHNSKCICGECKSQFKSLNKLGRHVVLSHHRGFFKCPTCLKRFLDMYSLKRHSNEFCQGIRPFKCVICQSSFKTQNSLDVHLSESH